VLEILHQTITVFAHWIKAVESPSDLFCEVVSSHFQVIQSYGFDLPEFFFKLI